MTPKTKPTTNVIDRLYRGLSLIFKYRDRIDFTDTDFRVIHKTAMLIIAPEHSDSGYISVATQDELPNHNEILAIDGWVYEYPYYVYYML